MDGALYRLTCGEDGLRWHHADLAALPRFPLVLEILRESRVEVVLL
ncbi:hypothetical protein [Kitasatospora sp. NBC_00039]